MLSFALRMMHEKVFSCSPTQEEASATSNDYCQACVRDSYGACPNPNCLSKGTEDHRLVPMDFLRVSCKTRAAIVKRQ